MLQENPIEVSGRYELANYLCFIHNIVNKRLGKSIFDCTNVLEFWGGKLETRKSEDNENLISK